MQDEIKKSIDTLKEGGVIICPTDTVWSLSCDATNEKAVDKIFEIKQRDKNKSLIILLDNDRKLNKYVREIPEIAWDLIEFSTSPLTIIYSDGINIAHNAIAKDKTIGIRIVKSGFAHELIKKYNKPIVSTSVNISNQPTISKLNQIPEEITKKVDYIVNLQNYKPSKRASRIIKLNTNGEFKILR